jgi:hypothetical protein
MLKLDPWQEEVLRTEGNICLRSGRQVGKSTIISIKAAEYAIKHPSKTILIISAVERQAQLLFEKTLGYLADNYARYIKAGKEKPTKHKIQLVNGSVIWCLPTGLSGYGIRGYTIDLLIADEAAFIPEDVWTAVTPMLATTKGNILLLSTPFGKGGYFYDCFNDPNFKSFHISSLDCPRADKAFLERERKRMTKSQFMQEYEGLFVDDLRRFFSDELIKKCLVLERSLTSGHPICSSFGDIFLGVDIARMGEDQSTFISLKKLSRDELVQVDQEITEKTLLTETIFKIKKLNNKYDYNKIFIDDGGIGAGVYDVLLQEDSVKRKIIAINNASRSLDRDDTKRKKLMKEDIYSNLLRLMENGSIKLFNDDELMMSLKSIQYEYKDGKILIFGNYSHLVEALVRAAWCVQDKKLNLWVMN